eukprot:scaffold465_cov120-Isochrysis_galbana.AAC.4
MSARPTAPPPAVSNVHAGAAEVKHACGLFSEGISRVAAPPRSLERTQDTLGIGPFHLRRDRIRAPTRRAQPRGKHGELGRAERTISVGIVLPQDGRRLLAAQVEAKVGERLLELRAGQPAGLIGVEPVEHTLDRWVDD